MNYSQLEKELKIHFDEKTQYQFENYINNFLTYNSHTNLISKNDEVFLYEKHIFDSFSINLFFEKYGFPKTLMDIGTGGGFPAIPLAFLLKNTKIFAVDSTKKKVQFLEQIKQKFLLSNLNPICSRIEDLKIDYKNSFDVVTSRALGQLPILLEYAIPYLKVGGYFVAYKSQNSDKELELSKNALKILKTELVDTIEYKLPLKENFERKLLIFRKKSECSKIYPRKNGLVKKSPL